MKACDEQEVRDSNKKTPEEIWVTQFTEKSALQFRQQVLEASEAEGPDKPITIYIDSYGGYVDSLASMLETLDEVPNPIITVAAGKSMSCGAILLSHGDYRFCGRYARVMVHEVSSVVWGNTRTIKNDANETIRLNRKFMELLARNCGMKGYEELKAHFKDKDADELWMGPEEALKFGIVDHIGMPKLIPLVKTSYQCAVVPAKPRISKEPEPTKKSASPAPIEKKKAKKKAESK